MLFFEPIHVNAEGQVFGRRVLIQLALQQNGVRAQIDIFFPVDQSLHDRGHFGMDQRFPAGNTDDRRAAFFSCLPTLLGGQAPVEHMIRVLNFSATGACQVAPEQRLQHHHQRVAFSAIQLLSNDVGGYGPHL